MLIRRDDSNNENNCPLDSKSILNVIVHRLYFTFQVVFVGGASGIYQAKILNKMTGKNNPPSEDDACAPFLLSQMGQNDAMHQIDNFSAGWKGDISAITSPNFDGEGSRSNAKPCGGSLFSRLTRGFSTENKRECDKGPNSPPITPTTTKYSTIGFDSLSTIKPNDSLIEHNEDAKLMPPRLEGTVDTTMISSGSSANKYAHLSSQMDFHRSRNQKHEYASAIDSPEDTTEQSQIESFQKLRPQKYKHAIPKDPPDNTVQSHSFIHLGDSIGEDEVPSFNSRRVESVKRKERIGKLVDDSMLSYEKSEHTRSVCKDDASWLRPKQKEITISTDSPENTTQPLFTHQVDVGKSAKASIQRNDRTEETVVGSISSFERSEHSRSTCNNDEWREVIDPESGRKYYYNRRTRVSKWRLPKSAVLAKPKKPCNISYSSTESQLKPSTNIQLKLNDDDSMIRQKHVQAPVVVYKRQQNNSLYSSEFDQHTTTPSLNESCSKTNCESSYYEKDEPIEREKYVTPNRDAVDHIKSPQDCTARTDTVFCLYCGLKCHSVAILGNHLNQCVSFLRMQERDLLTTHIEIEKILFNAWSQIGSSYKSPICVETRPVARNNVASTNPSFSDRSLSPNYSSPASTQPISGNKLKGNSASNANYDRYAERETIPTNFSASRPLEVSPKIRQKQVHVSDYCVDTKTCPFCIEVFTEGDQFSSHLLKCKERRRLRKQRRKKKTENHGVVDTRRRCATPGRRLPWER